MMVNFFMVGSDVVRWEVTSLGDDVCRLTVTHPNGTIVEYFRMAAGALERQKEIEALFLGPRQTRGFSLS
jgi:hypothetical protein